MLIFDNIFKISLYLLPILAALFAVIIILQIIQRRGRLIRSLNMSLFLIILPRESKKSDGEKNVKEMIARAEQLYSILGSIKTKGFWREFFYGPPHLGLEIASIGKETDFYVAMSRRWEETIIKHIQGIYPEVEARRVDDYNIFNPEGVEMASSAVLEKEYCLPLKTYKQLESDSLGEIANVFSKIREGEGGAAQIIFRKRDSNWRYLGQGVAREMQKGKDYGEAYSIVRKGTFRKIFGEMREASKGVGEKRKDGGLSSDKPLTPMRQEIIKSIEEKSSKMGFSVNLRLVASALTMERAEELLGQFEDAFSQFNSSNLNSFNFTRSNSKKIIYNFSFRNYSDNELMILNTEELASIFHFPLAATETPKIKWLKSRSAPPPAELSDQGLVLGRNIFRGDETKARIMDDDRRRHLYILGQTGTGKSVFMQEMIHQDMEKGNGVCVIDPHGDLIDKVLKLIPKERIEDVILFDPSDTELPLGLNMLEYNTSRPEQKTFIVNEMISIFHKLFGAVPEALGPMFEQYARNSLLLLLDNPDFGFTLMDVPRVLADADFRHFLLARENNLVVKEFWTKEAEKAGGEAALANISPYITSKFNIFIANDYIRPIIGQAKSSLNFREIMDNKKILLVNLTKGKLGDISSSLLGLIVVGKILLTSFSRVDMPEEDREDFHLYIDEFQNFTTESVGTILAEGRKYKLNLIIAHQFIGQLQEKIRDAVFGNIGSMVVFRVGAEDAEFIVKQYKPVFTESDLLNIDNFSAYVKLLINGKTSTPFNIETYPPSRGSDEIASSVKELSRKRYGRPKNEVEREILRRARVAEAENE